MGGNFDIDDLSDEEHEVVTFEDNTALGVQFYSTVSSSDDEVDTTNTEPERSERWLFCNFVLNLRSYNERTRHTYINRHGWTLVDYVIQ